MTLDDLRRLNIRDVGNWPTAPKLGLLGLLFLVIVALGAFFDWKDQYETLQVAEAQEQKLVERGQLVCMTGFGSGFTWGSAVLRW